MPGDDENNGQADAHVEALTGLLRPLLTALNALQFVSRHLNPMQLGQLTAQIDDLDAPLQQALATYQALDWPPHLSDLTACLTQATEMTHRALDGFASLGDDSDALLKAYRAIRHVPRAMEALYPLAGSLAPVSRFFLDDDVANDAALNQRLAETRATPGRTGIIHADNDRQDRGGFSLYVPEYYDPEHAYPLIMALHGGTGHGRAFLWTWLREARSRGAILISPTSRDDTWSLTAPDRDGGNIEAMLDHVRSHWNVDGEHMLLTGMSDGGTFCYVTGLRRASPFTHLAPIAASFHPFLLEVIEEPNIAGRRIYLTHGAQDWMFNIEIARQANAALGAAGADITYREIADLSHTYPREENSRIFDWLVDAGAASGG